VTLTFARCELSALRHVRLSVRRAVATSTLAYLLVFDSSRPAQGQQVITVRFVDFRSGKPIKNFYLVEAWSGKRTATVTEDTTIVREGYEKAHDGTVTVRLPEREAATAIFESSTKADKEGRVIIHLPEIPPERIDVFSFDLTELATDFSPAEVLEFGVVVPFRRDRANSKVKVLSKPGEIVVLSKRITAWDRMLQEIP
jgi:hypothetical protein